MEYLNIIGPVLEWSLTPGNYPVAGACGLAQGLSALRKRYGQIRLPEPTRHCYSAKVRP
jgi:hypothetical protein